MTTVPAKSEDDVTRFALRVVAANTRLITAAIITVVGLIVLGTWMYAGVKASLREVRAAELQTVLDAEVQALDVWVGDRRVAATFWAERNEVRQAVSELLEVVRVKGGDRDALWYAPARLRLDATLRPALKQVGAVAFNVVGPGGLIFGTQVRDYIGRRVNPGSFLAQLTPVFTKGATQFIRPYLERERIAGLTQPAFSRPVIWFDAPVRDHRGEIVAALGFGYYADEQFVRILSAAQPGETGEVYAFDANGVMLSDSRFGAKLKAAGLVPDTGDASTLLRVQIRDPGGDPSAGFKPELELAARPLTRIAAVATGAREKSESAQRRGVILEPYRNYRGVEVIGAWQWLRDHDFGIVVEIEAHEAYAPLQYINFAFTILLTLLAAVLLAVTWSMLSVRRLRRQVGDARILGQYRLEKQLGEGGMSKVYLARHALLKRPTALKMLKPHMATDDMVARFEREVQLASQLVHPNAVEIYDYGRTAEGVFYYVMEYLEGETLDKIVGQHGAMPIARAIHVLRQVCGALHEAHTRSLVHRDVKPQNIMLCLRGAEYDVVKILDFGLVKDVESEQSRDITQYQRMLGTPGYMAPERMRNPADADARSDIYSVGAVGFYLIAGREAFSASGQHDLTYHVLHTPAPRLSDNVPDAPRRLDDLIARCLAKDRSERPHDVVVVMALLEALAVDYPWTQREAGRWWRDNMALETA